MFERLKSAGPIVWAMGNWQVLAIATAVLVTSHTVSYFVGRGHGSDSVKAAVAEQILEEKTVATKSEAQSVSEKETDDQRIADQKEISDEAILETNSGGISSTAASDALMCVRLQRTNKARFDELPSCSRRTPQVGTNSGS